ncbi:MAG: HTH-type transcriptional repressor AseR [Pelotomaculum sp. PtaB.Bin104]|nr:MAG: HTH-type transcriptional repressor AseR [Pelotomaculum sp. PtaB.Bin104]
MMDTVKISKALSDPIRYKIMIMLANGQYHNAACCSSDIEGICNCEIMARFGMIQSRVSYHMKELVDAGLVKETAKGRWKYYFLNIDTLKEYIHQLKIDLGI